MLAVLHYTIIHSLMEHLVEIYHSLTNDYLVFVEVIWFSVYAKCIGQRDNPPQDIWFRLTVSVFILPSISLDFA